ncbi:unnamed protein product [Moneuplotes crassus]|uniref:Uncharacterized protein n=1 Tax=Euplotes crassus TaxID=5936 RepID=A0AAD1UTB7_EUPCR|nr:unnamed protein product [Moneuplotes crassus]
MGVNCTSSTFVKEKHHSNTKVVIDLEKNVDIRSVLRHPSIRHQNLAELRLTNLKLNFMEYIIHVGNNQLLQSCLKHRSDPQISEVFDRVYDYHKLCETALRCVNKEALEMLISYHENYDLRVKNTEGIAPIEVAMSDTDKDKLRAVTAEMGSAKGSLYKTRSGSKSDKSQVNKNSEAGWENAKIKPEPTLSLKDKVAPTPNEDGSFESDGEESKIHHHLSKNKEDTPHSHSSSLRNLDEEDRKSEFMAPKKNNYVDNQDLEEGTSKNLILVEENGEDITIGHDDAPFASLSMDDDGI